MIILHFQSQVGLDVPSNTKAEKFYIQRLVPACQTKMVKYVVIFKIYSLLAFTVMLINRRFRK